MQVINVTLAPKDQIEPVFPDLVDKYGVGRVIHVRDTPLHIVALEGGMLTGKTSIAIRVDLPDGKTVIAETSLAAFRNACAVLAAIEE